MHQSIKLFLGVLLAVSATASRAQLTTNAVFTMPEDEVIAELPNSHPSAYIAYASRLLKEGKKDEAVKWFYIGEIRYRFMLAAKKLGESDEEALFASLHSEVGPAINEWAGGAPSQWVHSIDAALDWDDENPNEYTSKGTYHSAWEQTRSGLQGLEKWIEKSHDEIRTKREAHGLENREKD